MYADRQMYFIEPCGVIYPLHLTHPGYLGAVCSPSAAPGDQPQLRVQGLGQGEQQEFNLTNRVAPQRPASVHRHYIILRAQNGRRLAFLVYFFSPRPVDVMSSAAKTSPWSDVEMKGVAQSGGGDLGLRLLLNPRPPPPRPGSRGKACPIWKCLTDTHPRTGPGRRRLW